MNRLFLVCVMIGVVNTYCEPSVITTIKEPGGRFGHKIMIYAKAKWYAHKHKIPFYYRPFKYGSLLQLHEYEAHHPLEGVCIPQKSVLLKTDRSLINDAGIMYTVTIHTKSDEWALHDEINTWHNMMADAQFCTQLRTLLQPAKPVEMRRPPAGIHTVAVHVRKPSGPDPMLYSKQLISDPVAPGVIAQQNGYSKGFSDKKYPNKFPPDQYYIDQIITLSDKLNNEPLYVCLFSDCPEINALVDRYQQEIGRTNICITTCQSAHDNHEQVLADMMYMACFDYLIRPVSCFSQIAQFMGNHKAVYAPVSLSWCNDMLMVDSVGVITR